MKEYTPASVFSSLSELERKRAEKGAVDHSMTAQSWANEKESGQDDDFILLAAAPERQGSSGSTFGVAVDEKTGEGYLVNVTAWVGSEVKNEGELSIVGSQVEGRSNKGTEYRLTAPLNLLRDKLSKRFKTVPWLTILDLAKRDVYVEIDIDS